MNEKIEETFYSLPGDFEEIDEVEDLKKKIKKLKSELSRSRKRTREAEEDRDVLMSSDPYFIDVFKDNEIILRNQKLPFFIKKGTQKLAKITFKKDGLYISKQEHIEEKLVYVDGYDLIKIKKAFKVEGKTAIHFENKIFQTKQYGLIC